MNAKEYRTKIQKEYDNRIMEATNPRSRRIARIADAASDKLGLDRNDPRRRKVAAVVAHEKHTRINGALSRIDGKASRKGRVQTFLRSGRSRT